MTQLPAATLAEGVLGLEAIHTFNGLSLNVKTAFPRYNIKRITGLRSKADMQDLREQVRGGIGEVVYPVAQGGKTIVYEGTIDAPSLPSLRAAETALMAATADTRNEFYMVIAPPAGRGGVSWAFIGKVLACSIDDEITTTLSSLILHRRAFVLTIRQSDPRYFSGSVDVSGSNGGTVSVTNSGNAPAMPIFTLNGPIDAPVLIQRVNPDPRMLEMAESIAWAAITSGRHLVVSFGRIPRAYSPEIGGDFTALVTFESDYWDDGVAGILPGAQNIKVTGCSWSLQFAHASW